MAAADTDAKKGADVVRQAVAAMDAIAKSAIKQVDRLLSNAGVAPWDLFDPWVREAVGPRREIDPSTSSG